MREIDNMEIQSGMLRTGKIEYHQEMHLDEYGLLKKPHNRLLIMCISSSNSTTVAGIFHDSSSFLHMSTCLA